MMITRAVGIDLLPGTGVAALFPRYVGDAVAFRPARLSPFEGCAVSGAGAAQPYFPFDGAVISFSGW